MALQSSNLNLSSPSRSFEVFQMSSSPLPSLNDLVMNVKGVEVCEVKNIEPKYHDLNEATHPIVINELLDTTKTYQNEQIITKIISKVSKPGLEIENSPKKKQGGQMVSEEGDKVKKINRKPKAKKTDEFLSKNSHSLSQKSRGDPDNAARKPVSKKTKNKPTNKSQNRFPKGNITKPLSSTTLATKFGEHSKNEIGELSLGVETSHLIDANKQPLESASAKDSAVSYDSDENARSYLTPACPINSGGISNGSLGLLGKFGYKKDAESTENRNVDGGIKKGKLIELMHSKVSTPGKVSKKKKAEKKKPKTLTDQAISVLTENDKPLPVPLSDYFPLQTIKRSSTSQPLIGEKKRLESSSKPKSNSSSSSKNLKSALLSPSSALKQVDQQDFVFGTSSQLAQEDSPTLLRDLHEAMQESNCLDDPFASSPIMPSSLKAVTANRNLWTAASRDVVGSLLDVELIDLVESPRNHNISCTMPVLVHDDWLDIGSSPSTKQDTATPVVVQPVGEAPRRIPSQRTLFSDKVVNSRETMSQKVVAPKKQKVNSRAEEEMPNFSSYTNAQLSKEIAAYHFKPIKKREQMITLLQQCWEGKKRMKSGVSSHDVIEDDALISSELDEVSEQSQKIPPANTQAIILSTAKTKRQKSTKSRKSSMTDDQSLTPKSRKRKNSRSLMNDKEELSNSDVSITPTCSRKKNKVFSPTPTPCLSGSEDTETISELSPASNNKSLFSHITQAIKNAPSKDSKPSWYEKILLYDPIVLEDLTAWLNTGALQKVNWDREVDPKDVKKWCESESICCLWRENLRGGARNRY